MQDAINFVYDTEDNLPENCINGLNKKLCMSGYHLALQSLFNINSIPTRTFFLTKDNLPSKFFYTICTINVFRLLEDSKDINGLLPQKILKALRAKHCTLVLLDWHERSSKEMASNKIRYIKKYCSANNIDINQIIFLYNTSLEENTTIENFAYGINYFWLVARINLFNADVEFLHSRRLKTIINKKFSSCFLCLNRIPRSHRCWLVYELWKNNLLTENKVQCSFTASIDSNLIEQQDFSQLRDDYNKRELFLSFLKQQTLNVEYYGNYDQFTQHLKAKNSSNFLNFCKILPLNLDTTKHSQNHWNTFNLDIFANSGIMITTETLFFDSYNDDVFLTEKTFKPILYQMPFINVSQPYTLHALKRMGFRTFSRFWDESYDTEINDVKRLYKIIELVKKISDMSNVTFMKMMQEMVPVLLHNYNLLMSKKIEQPFIRDMGCYKKS